MSIGDFANIVMAIATIGSLIYIARQVGDTRKHTKGQFLLEVDDRLRIYNHIHERLINDYPPLDPETDKDIHWPEVWQYIGFFERINIMLDDNILDIGLIYRLYGYRVYRIIHNDTLFAELMDGADAWQDFIRLCHAIVVYRKAEGADQVDLDFIERVNQLRIIQTKGEKDWRRNSNDLDGDEE